MLLLVAFSTGIGAFITFNMNSDVAKVVFLSLVVAVLLDFFIL